VLLDQIEKALMVVGDKVFMISGGHKNFDEYNNCDDNVTSELVIRPRALVLKSPTETRATLNEKTKQQICDLSTAPLNPRTEKKHLITLFLEYQEAD
jgi:hypothetical protein